MLGFEAYEESSPFSLAVIACTETLAFDSVPLDQQLERGECPLSRAFNLGA